MVRHAAEWNAIVHGRRPSKRWRSRRPWKLIVDGVDTISLNNKNLRVKGYRLLGLTGIYHPQFPILGT